MTSYEKKNAKLEIASNYMEGLDHDLYEMLLGDTDSYLSDDIEKTANVRAAVKEIAAYLLRDLRKARDDMYSVKFIK